MLSDATAALVSGCERDAAVAVSLLRNHLKALKGGLPPHGVAAAARILAVAESMGVAYF
jgi:hypothetical protein